MTEEEWFVSVDPQAMHNQLSSQQTGNRRTSNRKLRLFALECCSRIWNQIPDAELMRGSEFLVLCGATALSEMIIPDCGRKAVEQAELFADGKLIDNQLEQVREVACALTYVGDSYAATKPTIIGAGETDYLLLAIGSAGEATEAACNSVEYLDGRTSRSAAVASAYLKSHPDDPLPQPDVEELAAQAHVFRDIFGNPFRPVVADPAWLTPTVVAIAASLYQDRAFDRLPILADALEEAGCTNADLLLHCRQPGEHVRGCWAVDLVLGKE